MPDKPVIQIAILSRHEAASPVFAHLFPEVFNGFDQIIILEDLIDSATSGFPVNRVLMAQHRLLGMVKNASRVISTIYRGAPYYLLDGFTGQLDLFAFQLVGLETSLGAVMQDSDIAHLELEEAIISTHRNKILFRNPAMATYLDHRFGPDNAAPPDPIGPAAAFPDNLADPPFVTLPGGAVFSDPSGPALSPQDYVSWASTGQIPPTLAGLDLARHVLLDQANDHLQLGRVLLAQNAIGGVLLAIDQKRPTRPAYPGQIMAYNDAGYLRQICANGKSGQKTGAVARYPGHGDPAPFVSISGQKTGPVAISVIITHFNRPDLLAACLRGFQAQTRADFEIIIVDNGSDSARLPALPDLPGAQTLTLVRNLNTYPGYARNLGASLARGTYVLFFDDDNIPKPDLLEKMLAAMHSDTGDLISCFRQTFIGTPDKPGEVILSAPDLVETSQLRNFMGDVVFMMRRARFEHLRFSDYFRVGREDFEILYQARRQGLKIHVIPEALYLYRLDNGDKIGNRHLTHRPGGHGSMDFGAFRKFRRAAGSQSAARVLQLLETYHAAARTARRRFIGLVWLKQSLRRITLVRRLYYRWFRR